MYKLGLVGQNLGQVFNSSPGCVGDIHIRCNVAKLNNLKLESSYWGQVAFPEWNDQESH